MSSEGAPESWDQDVSNNLQKLNVNASAFVPNVNATEFVPSWGTPSPKPVQSAENSAQPTGIVQPPANSNASPAHSASAERSPTGSASPAHRPPSNEKTVDNWEDADNSEKSGAGQGSASATPATTPEEEENSIDNEAFVPASKPRTKVKPKVEEATTTEKEHVNVVFIGHVDAGKSTIGGQIMYLTGMVDKRTLEKYEREAKEKIVRHGTSRGAWIPI